MTVSTLRRHASAVFVLALLAACSEGGAPVGAPHPIADTWLVRTGVLFHGDGVTDRCFECHDPNRKCFECHFGPDGSRVPPGAEWEHARAPHGADVLKDEADACNRCHDLMRGFAQGPEACHDCHGQGVDHPVGRPWLDKARATFHGIAARQDLRSCAPCHGEDYRGGEAGVSCYRCHFGPSGRRSPAGSDWRHGTSGHARHRERQAVCNACHGINRRYGHGPGECHDCHDD